MKKMSLFLIPIYVSLVTSGFSFVFYVFHFRLRCVLLITIWSRTVMSYYFKICSQALNMNVDIGMPHNQLGTLSGTCNYGLDAAYHYMRW